MRHEEGPGAGWQHTGSGQSALLIVAADVHSARTGSAMIAVIIVRLMTLPHLCSDTIAVHEDCGTECAAIS